MTPEEHRKTMEDNIGPERNLYHDIGIRNVVVCLKELVVVMAELTEAVKEKKATKDTPIDTVMGKGE